MDSGRDNGFDPREFRAALGCFATGVTVVTTRNGEGAPVGLTANSFNSVSLSPPLVLWSLARSSPSLAAFSAAPHWVVHILAADQEDLSKRFATRGIDKFAGLDFDTGVDSVPLLRGCAARFQCRTAFQYDGGDHVIFVGEVIGFDRSPASPLVFHDGRYALTLPKGAPQSSGLTGSFSKDFLGYLVGRSHVLIRRRLKGQAKPADVGNDEHFVLSALAVHEKLTPRELEATVGDLLAGPLRDTLMVLEAQGHLRCEGSGTDRVCELAGSGRERALRTMAAAKSFEADVVDRFGAEDTFILKTLLRRLLDVMSPTRGRP